MNVTPFKILLRKIFFTMAGTRYRLKVTKSDGRTLNRDYCFYHYANTAFDVWMRISPRVTVTDRATGETLCSASFSIG